MCIPSSLQTNWNAHTICQSWQTEILFIRQKGGGREKQTMSFPHWFLLKIVQKGKEKKIIIKIIIN